MRIELSSSALSAADAAGTVACCAKLAAAHGFEFGVQLHNTATAADLERMAALGVPLSFHAPILGEYNLNLAMAGDAFEPWFAAQAELFRRYGVNWGVFHGFFMTDKPLRAFGHGASYDECMSAIARPELLRDDGSRFVRDYTGTAEFLMRRERVKHNLAWLRRSWPDIHWCIENDFPAYAAGNLRGCDAAALESGLCLDTGHLWATARILELDFMSEAATMLASRRVKMVHLHQSRYTRAIPLRDWGDGHLPLAHAGELPWPELVRLARAAGSVEVWVLEIVRGSGADLEAFFREFER